MLDVVEAVQGPLRVRPCSSALGVCPRRPVCRVSPHWRKIEEKLIQFLQATTLADIVEGAPAPGGPLEQVGGKAGASESDLVDVLGGRT